MTNRLCKLCGEWKPLSTEFFHRFKTKSKSGDGWNGGFRYNCKQCLSARNKKKLQEMNLMAIGANVKQTGLNQVK